MPEQSDTVTGQVEIEVVAWVTKFVGGDGSSRKVYHQPIEAGDTVRTVLRRLSKGYPQLHKALWGRGYGRFGGTYRGVGQRRRARRQPHPR